MIGFSLMQWGLPICAKEKTTQNHPPK